MPSVLCKDPGFNGHLLLFVFLADDFNGSLVFVASHCVSTVVDFWH